jgi:hypothetical protein
MAQAVQSRDNATGIVTNLSTYQATLAAGLMPPANFGEYFGGLQRWQAPLVASLQGPGPLGSNWQDAVGYLLDRATWYQQPIPGKTAPTWYQPNTAYTYPALGTEIPGRVDTVQAYAGTMKGSKGKLTQRGIPLPTVRAGYAYGGLNSPPLAGSREDPRGIRRPVFPGGEPFGWTRRI